MTCLVVSRGVLNKRKNAVYRVSSEQALSLADASGWEEKGIRGFRSNASGSEQALSLADASGWDARGNDSTTVQIGLDADVQTTRAFGHTPRCFVGRNKQTFWHSANSVVVQNDSQFLDQARSLRRYGNALLAPASFT